MNLDEPTETDAMPPCWPGLALILIIAAMLIASIYF
jgi:hypothetical protein